MLAGACHCCWYQEVVPTPAPQCVSCSRPAGLLNSENPDWVSSFIAAAGQRYEQELQAGEVVGPRLLLRLFACLTHTSVLHPTDVLGLMERTVDVALKQAATGTALLDAII